MSTEKEEDMDVSNVDDFDKLLELVRHDANLVDNLTDDQVTELRKKLNPYGRTIEGSGKLTCLSITNLSEAYTKKLLMTSLIGFLYRQCDEYDLDEGEPPCPMDDFENFMLKYNEALEHAAVSKDWLVTFNNADKDTELTIEQSAEQLDHKRRLERGEGYKRRLIVRQFLDNLFQFNPDKHVRSAYSDNPLDPERVKPAQVKRTKKVIVGKSGSTLTVKEPVSVEKPEEETEEETKRSNSSLVKHIPPLDTFHRWTYYTDSNYEEIRAAVQDLYCDKPDLEFAINPYDQFDSKESAEKYVQKHKNEVIADVITLTNGKWNLCGSFKKNRDRINFYNERTTVIEEIFKQIEVDKKLGADMMRKRVKKKKAKNVEECGPDPEEFKQYRKNHPSAIESMGTEDVLRDEKLNIDKEDVTFKIHEECPYDSVQVDVFDFRRGGETVTKSEFYTQAENPQQLIAPSEPV